MNTQMAAAPPCIIDVEASGFGPHSYPIEVGVVLDTGEKYCSLIAPPEGWTHWDDEAEQVHRISRDVLEHAGRSPEAVARDLNAILADRTVYSDGWVVDKPWLTKLFESAGIDPDFRTSSLEMILSEAQMRIWHQTKQAVLSEYDQPRHRASFDALVIQQTWMRTRQALLSAA